MGYCFQEQSIQDSITCDVIDSVMTMIENTEKVGEWILCSERLPDPDDDAIVTYENYDTKKSMSAQIIVATRQGNGVISVMMS